MDKRVDPHVDAPVRRKRAKRAADPVVLTADVVRAALDSPALTSDSRELLTHLLRAPGRILAESGPSIWPVSVRAVAFALGGQIQAAAIAAAAVELAVAAIDVADELIDGEWQGDERSRARALNASLTLSFLAQRCAADLTVPLGPVRALSIGRLLAEGCMASCAGQDLDLLLEDTDASDEDALEMTSRKSGSLVGMAFKVGAAVASDAAAVVDAAGMLGAHVGVVAQLLNDLQDVGSDASRRKGDLRRGKRTLPIAYAVQCAREEQMKDVIGWFEARETLSAEHEDLLVARMHDMGAQQYAWTVAQAHRHQALAALRALAQVAERPQVMRLRELIPRSGS